MVITKFEDIGQLASIIQPMWDAVWKLIRKGGPKEAENLCDLMGHLCDGMLRSDQLEPNRDIFGGGTIDDPFRFRRELNYQSCIYKYLKDAGLEFSLATIHKMDENGLVERVDTVDGQALYFFKDSVAVD